MKRVLVALLVASACKLFSQGELPVDMNTGRPIISVPFATISAREIADNISLNYDASGVKVQQPAGNYGMGWNLAVGGSITRQVRSLPDEFYGAGVDARRGWLYTNASGLSLQHGSQCKR